MPDYRIDSDFPRSSIERWDANVQALRVLKQIESEQREATPQEQRALAQYSGFGDSAFEQAFSYYGSRDPAWKRRREDLEAIATEEEMEGIRRSRLNAFFTSKPIIEAMWKGLSDMGADKLDRPKILEPSVGSGRFLGLQPAEMAEKSERVAVELDPLTARITRQVYPDTKVYNTGFQDAPTQDNYFDIAISNVPFGSVKVNDREFNATGRKHLTNQVHNYFFAKALDKLRPGGVMAFITSHGTLDAPANEPTRRYLAERADLLGAVRLPDDAFPDTQVVTDIIYLRKRAEGDPPADDSWVNSTQMMVGSTFQNVNDYYRENPDKVLGTHSSSGSMYRGDSYTVRSDPQKPLAPWLAGETRQITRNAAITEEAKADVQQEPVSRVKGVDRYVMVDGEVHTQESGGEREAERFVRSANERAGGPAWKVTERPTEKANLSAADTQRVKSLIEIREATRQLLNLESNGSPDERVEKVREELRSLYDGYVEEYDEAINTPENRKLFKGGADDHLLFALERYDRDTDCWTEADILNRRVVGAVPAAKVNTAGDALTVVQNATGEMDFERMGELLGRDAHDVQEELAQKQLIFRTPAGVWVSASEYLSGNVREKAKQAQLIAQSDSSFLGNLHALEAVMPATVEADEIVAPLGAPWVPGDVVNQWIKEHFRPDTFNRRGSINEWVRYSDEGEAFVGENDDGKNTRVGAGGSGGWVLVNDLKSNTANIQWGTDKKKAQDILMHSLQGSPIVVTAKDDNGKTYTDQAATVEAQEKAAEMQRSFREWIWEDPARRAKMVSLYNEIHNAYRPREFDGSDLALPGMSAEWQRKLHPHQRDAIARVVNDGTTLLAHEVGFGKTATMIAAAKERKRLGLANKPVFVVPKATHEQFVKQFDDLYPGARVLSPDKDDFKAGNREQFLSRIATGDWDGVVLSSEQFQSIPVSPETETRWIQQQKDEMVGVLTEMGDAEGKQAQRTQKQIAKKIENYDVRLQQLADKMALRADDAVYFDDLGIDSLTVDEADRYKNLPYATNMAGSRGGVKGLPQSESQRAWDMFMKVRYLQEKSGTAPDGNFAKGGIVFATGTPVANTIAETYTMMRYLEPDELKRRGLGSFDSWAQTYGDITAGIEQTAAGSYKPVQRFSRFVNLPELGNLFQNVADIRVASEVPEMRAAQPNLVDLEGENKRITVVAPSHPALEAYMEEIIKRAESLGQVPPEEDNMLKISSDARKASMDVRMVDPSAPYNPHGKVAMAAENISRIYREEAPDKGTQLVFLDLGTPKAKEGRDSDAPGDDPDDLTNEEQTVLKNVYATLRNELTAKGVPEDQVAFIHDYKTPAQREELFNQVRAGDMRILVGSTEKIGVGVNVQDRAAAAHHIDVPWRPRDVEQREGRIIRQGNEVYGPKIDEETNRVIDPGKGVQIYQYVQEKSFDGFMWQAIEVKARAIKSLMKREHLERGMEDIDPFVLGVAEAKALASGNPLVKRAEELKLKVTTGRFSLSAHRKQQDNARLGRQDLEASMKRWRETLPALEADAERVQSIPEKADFAAVIAGKDYEKRAEAGEALATELKKVTRTQQALGSYKGFQVDGFTSDQGYHLSIKHPDGSQEYSTLPTDRNDVNAAGLMARLDNLMKGIPERARTTQNRITEGESTLGIYAERLGKPFAQESQLEHAARQLRVIQARLSDSNAGLQPGDDIEMDVDSDVFVAALPTRQAPDVDSVNVRTAVEAVDGVEQAEDVLTSDEVADALEGNLDNRAANVQTEPPARREIIERVKALAAIHPSRFSDVILRDVDGFTDEEAAETVEDYVLLIEAQKNPDKLKALQDLLGTEPEPAEPAQAEPPAHALDIDEDTTERELQETVESPQTVDEMWAASQQGPVALTGPGSIMEKLAEERAQKAAASDKWMKDHVSVIQVGGGAPAPEPEPVEKPVMGLPDGTIGSESRFDDMAERAQAEEIPGHDCAPRRKRAARPSRNRTGQYRRN